PFLLVRAAVRDGVLIHPVLLFPAHAFAPRHLAHGAGTVRRTRLRPVAKGLEAVFAPVRFPLIEDDLNRHAAAPATGAALRIVGSGVQSTFASLPVDRQRR